MSLLRVAVLGLGEIGSIHLSRWSEISGAEIASVCDIEAEIATKAATECECEGHTDWQAALLTPGVNVVDICLPNYLHFEVAQAAFAAGCHVLCETPVALTAAETSKLESIAFENNLRFYPGFCHRLNPGIVFAKELLENDDLGMIRMIRARFSANTNLHKDHWVNEPDISGGGAARYLGQHGLDMFRYLAGEISSCYGISTSFSPELTVEDSAVFCVQSSGGTLGSIEVSWSCPGGRNIVEIYGSAGVCIVDYDTEQVRFKTADMVVWEYRDMQGPDMFHRQILHFADVVRGIQSPIAGPADAVRANEITELCFPQKISQKCLG